MCSKRLFAGGYGVTAVSSATADIANSRHAQRPPFPYTGSKRRLAPLLKKIIEDAVMNYGVSEDYRELFGGSGAVMFSLKPGLFRHYHYQDKDQNIVNFFQVLSDEYHLYELIDVLLYLGVEEEVFEQAKKALSSKQPLPLVESAAYAYITIVQSYAAGRQAFNPEYRLKYKMVEKYYKRVQKLDSFYPFLSSQVEIKSGDAFELLEETMFDSYSLTYLDPPYSPDSEMSGEHHYGANSLSVEQHEKLVDLLVESHSKIILSGYDNPQYVPLEECGWNKYFLTNLSVPAAGAVKKRVSEFVWINFQLSDELERELQQRAYLNPLDMNGIQQQTPFEGGFTNGKEGFN